MTLPEASATRADQAAKRLAAAWGPPESSLKKLAIRGGVWVLAGFGAQHVLRLVGNLIVTRLLFPEAFGLMALVQVFMYGLQMVSDVGVGPAVLRHERGDDPRFLNTAWTLQVTRGVILWAGACALAGPLARFYGEPVLGQVLPIAGLTAVISGFNSTGLFTAKRHLRLGRLVAIEVTSGAFRLAVMISWAAIDRSVWALVAGGLAGTTALAILSHTVLRTVRHRFLWEREALHALFRFGKWIFLSSLIFFISSQLDRILLGRYVGMASLGYYTIAFMLAQMPIQINMRLTRSVLYPSLSRVFREEPHRVQEVFYRARRSLDVVFLPTVGFLMGCGYLVIDFMYDSRYAQAGWIFQALCLRAAMRCMLEPCESCLVALGFPRYAFMQHCSRLAWVAAFIPLGWFVAGFQGLVLAVALCEIPVLPVLYYGMHRHRVLDLKREGRAWLLALVGLLIGLGAAFLASRI